MSLPGLSWIERKKCATCGSPLRRFSNSNCSMACRDLAGRISRSRKRLDELMAKYRGAESAFMRDLWLTMADEETGTLKFLIGWDRI